MNQFTLYGQVQGHKPVAEEILLAAMFPRARKIEAKPHPHYVEITGFFYQGRGYGLGRFSVQYVEGKVAFMQVAGNRWDHAYFSPKVPPEYCLKPIEQGNAPYQRVARGLLVLKGFLGTSHEQLETALECRAKARALGADLTQLT